MPPPRPSSLPKPCVAHCCKNLLTGESFTEVTIRLRDCVTRQCHVTGPTWPGVIHKLIGPLLGHSAFISSHHFFPHANQRLSGDLPPSPFLNPCSAVESIAKGGGGGAYRQDAARTLWRCYHERYNHKKLMPICLIFRRSSRYSFKQLLLVISLSMKLLCLGLMSCLGCCLVMWCALWKVVSMIPGSSPALLILLCLTKMSKDHYTYYLVLSNVQKFW